LKSVLKVRNASVKVEWVEREDLSFICIKALVKEKGRHKSTERGLMHGSVLDEE